MKQLFNHPLSPRAQTKINITFEDIYKIVRERLEYYTVESDPDAFCQNMCCEIEKKMGIYPNLPELKLVKTEKESS